jgi:hypothetical protein
MYTHSHSHAQHNVLFQMSPSWQCYGSEIRTHNLFRLHLHDKNNFANIVNHARISEAEQTIYIIVFYSFQKTCALVTKNRFILDRIYAKRYVFSCYLLMLFTNKVNWNDMSRKISVLCQISLE